MQEKRPRVCVGVIVENPRKEVLLLCSHKWQDGWVVPGGGVEWGETFEEAARREVREETGLSITSVRCIGTQEAVFPKNFHRKRHFVFINLVAKTKGRKVTLNHESHDYRWIRPTQALRTVTFGGGTKNFITMFLKMNRSEKD